MVKITISIHNETKIKIKVILVQVRQRFYNHEDFMLELQSHQGAVRKVFLIIMILVSNAL